MKKLLGTSLLALGLVLASHQEASAWTKFGISVGASINYEGANNNFLWGGYKGGQVPGYPTDIYIPTNAAAQGFGPGGGGMMLGGGGPQGAPQFMDYNGMGGVPQPMPGANPLPVRSGETQAVYYSNGTVPVNYYAAPTGGYYQTPTYGYTNYNFGNYQMPAYWYGN